MPIAALQKDPSRVLLPAEVPGLVAAGYREPTAAPGAAGGGGKGASLAAASGGHGASGGSGNKQQEEEKQRRSLKNQIAALLSLLDRHPSSWPFRRPVSVSEAPDYYEVVKHPVDISSMRKRNKSVGFSKECAFEFSSSNSLRGQPLIIYLKGSMPFSVKNLQSTVLLFAWASCFIACCVSFIHTQLAFLSLKGSIFMAFYRVFCACVQGGYRTKEELGSDMVRMFENCRLYNSSDTIYYKYADELQHFIWPKYEALSGP
ncbi:hypothetical protein ACSSS7_004114 [Eimeria intestinalis]